MKPAPGFYRKIYLKAILRKQCVFNKKSYSPLPLTLQSIDLSDQIRSFDKRMGMFGFSLARSGRFQEYRQIVAQPYIKSPYLLLTFPLRFLPLCFHSRCASVSATTLSKFSLQTSSAMRIVMDCLRFGCTMADNQSAVDT